jgi:hypothetical protein
MPNPSPHQELFNITTTFPVITPISWVSNKMASPAAPPNPAKPDVETTMHTNDPISKIVVDTGRRHTFYANERGVRFNLVALHRMNMHYLRKRLIDEAGTIFTNGSMDDDNSRTLTGLMKDYCSLPTGP